MTEVANASAVPIPPVAIVPGETEKAHFNVDVSANMQNPLEPKVQETDSTLEHVTTDEGKDRESEEAARKLEELEMRARASDAGQKETDGRGVQTKEEDGLVSEPGASHPIKPESTPADSENAIPAKETEQHSTAETEAALPECPAAQPVTDETVAESESTTGPAAVEPEVDEQTVEAAKGEQFVPDVSDAKHNENGEELQKKEEDVVELKVSQGVEKPEVAPTADLQGVMGIKATEQPTTEEAAKPNASENQAEATESVNEPVKEEASEPEPIPQPTTSVESEVKDDELTTEATNAGEDTPEAVAQVIVKVPAKEEEPVKAEERTEQQSVEETLHEHADELIKDETSIANKASIPLQATPEAEVPVSVEQLKDEEPFRAEESATTEKPVAVEELKQYETPPELVPESTFGAPTGGDPKPQDAAKIEQEPAPCVGSEDTAPSVAQDEYSAGADAATKAYESAHAHENDEVVADQPNDAEINAVTLEDAAKDAKGEIEAEEPVTTAEPNANDEPAMTKPSSEPAVESLRSIPTEMGEMAFVINGESTAPSIPDEIERDGANEPEAAAISKGADEWPRGKTDQAPDVSDDATACVTKTAKAAAGPETVGSGAVVEEPAHVAVSVNAPSAAEHEIGPDSEADGTQDQSDVQLPAETVSSDVAAGVAPEKVREDLAEALNVTDVDACKEKAEELGAAPSTGGPDEPSGDFVAEAPSVEAEEVARVSSVGAHTADVIVVDKPLEPMTVEEALSAPVSATGEPQENVQSEQDTTGEIEDRTTAAEVSVAAEGESSVTEAIVGQIALAKEIMVSDESASGETDAAGEMAPSEEQTKETPATECQPKEPAEPPVQPVEALANVKGVQVKDAEPEDPTSGNTQGLSEIIAHEAPVEVPAEKSPPLAEAGAVTEPVSSAFEEIPAVQKAEAKEELASEPVQGNAEQSSAETVFRSDIDIAPVKVGEEIATLEDRAAINDTGVRAEASIPALPTESTREFGPTAEDSAANSHVVDEVTKIKTGEDQSEIASVVKQTQEVDVINEEAAAPKGLDPVESIKHVGVLSEEPTITQQEDRDIDAQREAKGKAVDSVELTQIIVADTEGQEVVAISEEPVPDVQVEMPTPSSEPLSFSPEDDEQVSDIPLVHRLAEAVGITAAEIARLPALSSSIADEDNAPVSEEELATPTEIKEVKGETVVDKAGAEEESTPIKSQETEVPSELTQQCDNTEKNVVTAPAGLSIDTDVTEVPERSKSPWTPSYSVTVQGSAPVHSEESAKEIATDEVVDVSVMEAARVSTEKPAVGVNTVQTDIAIPPSEGASESNPTAPSDDAQPPEPSEPVDISVPAEDVEVVPNAVEPTAIEDEPPAVKIEEQHRTLGTEDQFDVTDKVVAKDEAPICSASAVLSVDTSVGKTPERPRSPWTPSYTVTKQGPGIPKPEELDLDAEAPADIRGDVSEPLEEKESDVLESVLVSQPQDATAQASDVLKSASEIERPKSPYPPSYSVTQMGSGVAKEDVEESSPSSPISGSVAASVVDSNEPEAPSSPRSDLGVVTPGFDTRSEVSEASHIPIPPDSPRSDPDAASLGEGDVKTPLVVGSEDQGTPISPLHTPLIIADKTIVVDTDHADKSDAAEFLTESAVSGFDADVEADRHSTTTGSWVKDTDMERESHADSVAPESAALLSDNDVSDNVDQGAVLSKETPSADNNITTSALGIQLSQGDCMEAAPERDVPDVSPSAPELAIPKLDVTTTPPAAQSVVVTNSLSTGSAYTQISDSLSPSQETGTNVTTPDVETIAMPNVDTYTGSEVGTIESVDEETISHVSDKPWSSESASRTPTGTEGGKSLGVTHTLAMRSFPSAFNAGADSTSPTEQSKQAAGVETPDADQLTPLSPRRRLESTVSSLAFPGGWITSPPQKERASLEVATGEFSRPIIEGNPVSPVTTPATTEENNESKWRCVIM